MKKKTIIKSVIGGIGLATTLGAIALASDNQLKIKKEKDCIDAYGTKIKTTHGMVNVSIVGDGENVFVLLPGYGTASPIYDYEPFAKKLAGLGKVITIEYLGYGDSDDTDEARTIEMICNEVHEVVSYLNIDKYWLVPHSISGVYALAYTQMYADEVAGVIAIDISVPKQNEKVNPKLETILSSILHYSGLGRLFMKLKPGMFVPENDLYEPYKVEQMKYRSLQKASKAVLDEGKRLNDNMIACYDMKFPKKMPILLFLCKSTIAKTKNWWLDIHKELLADHEANTIILLEGTHYLHHDNANEMVDSIQEFVSKCKKNSTL